MKKKTKAVKKAAVKKVKKAKGDTSADTLNAANFESQVKAVLSHLLDLFKASLLDAFRQYVCSTTMAGHSASVEDFMEIHENTVKAHGISKETLLGALSEVELEIMANSAGKAAVKVTSPDGVKSPKPIKTDASVGVQSKAADQVASGNAAKDSKSVFDSLDMIEI